MPWGFLLNPLPRGAAGKKKKGSKMAKRRKKRKSAAKGKRRRGVATRSRTKRRAPKRRAPKKRRAKRKAPVPVKKARSKARKAIAKGKRKKLTPFFTFMMGLPGKQSVAKAKKAGAKWRKMTHTQKSKYGAIYTETQRKAARKRSRKHYKKVTLKKKRAPITSAWKKRRGKKWLSGWKKGMRSAFDTKGEKTGYMRALMEGVAKVNPFGSTRRRRVYRKGNPVAKRRKSRRKAGTKSRKRRKSTKRRKRSFTPIGFMNPRRRRKSSRKSRRRNPIKIVSAMKQMTTKSALTKFGWVTTGVVAGAIAPNLLAKGINKLVPTVNLDTPMVRAGIGIVGSMLAGAVTGMVTKSQEKGLLVAAGGIASVVGALAIDQVNRFLPGVAGMGYLGATDSEVRATVEREIRRELGIGSYVTQPMLQGPGMGDYVTSPMVSDAGTAAGLGLETADDVDDVDTFEGGSF